VEISPDLHFWGGFAAVALALRCKSHHSAGHLWPAEWWDLHSGLPKTKAIGLGASRPRARSRSFPCPPAAAPLKESLLGPMAPSGSPSHIGTRSGASLLGSEQKELCMPAAFPLAVNVGIKRVRHRFGGCRAMKESPRMASEVSKDFQSNLLMSLNHQKCARSQT
jgi:hypothetical protein